MMPRLQTSAFAAIFAANVLLGGTALAETIKVSIVQTNDIDRMEEDEGRGGFARLAAVVAAERAKGDVLFVHAGDTVSPSLLSGIDKGAHVIDILNHMDVDLMVPGNHEFDFGPEVFQARISEAAFPIVSSNISMPGGGGPANTTVDRIVEIGGIKLGFYGLTTTTTPEVSSPGPEIAFLDPLETGLDAAEDLRTQGADIVLALVHTGLDVDLDLVRNEAADIILSGHDEHLLAFYNGKTTLTEAGAQGDRVVITDLTIEKTEKDGKVSISWEPAFRIVDTKDVEPDPAIAALVKTYEDKLDKELGVAIGTTETPLDSRRATVRGGEAAIGNLIADAMREAVDADVAMTNGGGIRADREYPAGTSLTRADIFAELPFGNRTVKYELTGAQLETALENGFANYPETDGRNPQISGMVVTVDLDKPVGERVLSVTVGGAPLDPAKTYTVATNDFMARGGNGYVVFAEGKALVAAADGKLLASDTIDYIAAKGAVAPMVEGRIVTK
jgi:5'-nucleotidase/UDP-sugar diphosphatase